MRPLSARPESVWDPVRPSCLLLAPVMFVAVIVAGTFPASAAPPLIRVEEDWELRLREPHPNTESPQVTCLISPVDHARGIHAAFELNHRTQPEYAAGGMQLQVWDQESVVNYQNGPQTQLLENEGEVVRWTQQMRLEDGKLVFEILNGSSTTWGDFGGQGYLKVAVGTSLQSLDGYSPGVSADNSGIGYAANRIAELTLKQDRVYSAEGLEAVSPAPLVVHRHE